MISLLAALAPIIVAFNCALPCDDTPHFQYYGWSTNSWGQASWLLTFDQSAALCRDVTLTFTSDPDHTYVVEVDYGWNQWRGISPMLQGPGETITFRTGAPYAWAFYRVRVME